VTIVPPHRSLDEFIAQLSTELGMSAREGLDHFAAAMRRLALGRVNAPEEVPLSIRGR
jgi:hypothetical protein